MLGRGDPHYPNRQGDLSLLGVQQMMSDPDYRARVVRFSRNSAVRTFWDQEFPHWPPQFAAQALSPLQNMFFSYSSC